METPSGNNVQIAAAKLQNITDLASLARRSFLQAYPQVTADENMKLYLDEAFSTDVLTQQFADPFSIFFIMKKGQADMGYAKLRWDRTPEHFKPEKAIELERLYFLDDYKGKGYGVQLLEYCKNFAIDNRFDWMWLLVWDENPEAIRFYKRRGFQEFGRKFFQFGNAGSDDLLMKTRL